MEHGGVNNISNSLTIPGTDNLDSPFSNKQSNKIASPLLS